MYIKFIVFYTIVCSIKFVLTGVNIDHGSNQRNTHRIQFNNQYNGQNVQITNKPMFLPGISRNLHQHDQNVRQQRQNIEGLSQNPLNKVHNIIEPTFLSNKRVQHFHNSENQFTTTAPRNDKLNNIEGQTQNNLRQEINHHHSYPEISKVLPFTGYGNKERLSTGLVNNENTKIVIPSTHQPVSRVPHVDASKQHSNSQRYGISHAIDRQKPVIHHQNVFSHQRNMQPQKTLQNQRSNIQTNRSPQNKRFAVIHDNGSVEYFNNLDVVIGKYPHIRIANNIRKLIPYQNPTAPLAKPMAHNSNSLGNIKISRPLEQRPKLPDHNIPTGILHTLKSTLKPIIETNTQKKNTLLMDKSNYNFSSLKTSELPVKIDDKKENQLAIQPKELPKKPTSNIQIKVNLQENKENKFTTTAKDSENTVTTKFNDVSTTNNKTTPLKNVNPIGKLKPSIDVILDSDSNLLHNENKSIKSVIAKNEEDPQKVIIKLEKDNDLKKSKEVISPIILPIKNNNKSVNTISENKPETINNSPSNHNTVAEGSEKKSNCTKLDGVKNKSKVQNSDVIKQTDKEDVDEDYDEELLSLGKPLMWFSTTDPEFWKKLFSFDDNPNFLYIVNVQSQPKIEKDRKTTIHANGTIVEEIIETVWDAGDDEQPKITKTIKVTPANAVIDGT